MARNLDPKCKQCRRLSEKLFLKGERCFSPKCAMVKRNYPPGMHGPKGTQRLSSFGKQFKEKQKTVKAYRLLEKQFTIYYQKAKQMKGDSGENLIRLLEMRLDNVIYRLGLASSRDSARQLIGHGHIQVNGKKVDIPSYQVRVGEIINAESKYAARKPFQEAIKKINKKNIPAWLTYIDEGEAKAKVTAPASIADLRESVDAAMIVEYYSR
jgi:small subunit ribosomal protein S4